MRNHYPWWKWLIIAVVVIPGLFYALPNMFGNDLGIQIRGSRGATLTSSDLAQIQSLVDASGSAYRSIRKDDRGISVRLATPDDQLRVRDMLERELGNRYTVALTLLPAAPDLFTSVGAKPMYLGLDLRGGVHFLMEVDMNSVARRAQERYVADIRAALRKEKLRYKEVRNRPDGTIDIWLRDVSRLQEAQKFIQREFSGLVVDDAEVQGEKLLTVRLSESEVQDLSEFALTQNITALRNRIDELGVAEPVVQRQGDRRIVVQLPGVQDTARAKRILGRTATLEMMLVDEEHSLEAALNGSPIVSITLDAVGSRINQRITGDNIGKRMAVVYIETRSRAKISADGQVVTDQQGRPVRVRERIEEVITAPVIRDQLGKRFQIEGLDSVTEARDLALMLRAGSLAAPVEIIEERTVGPSLGRANIEQGFLSVVIGFVLVLVFMLLYYRAFGLFANVALGLNLVLIVAVLSMFQATLTLPGVAGIVLTVGMAVDANVLIFERIREELRNGNTPQASIHLGYDRALSTIVDANITTLIAAIVLFNFGTGPIKGFAVTLSIGILTSMFTAIFVTRGLANLMYGRKRVNSLAI